MIFVFIIWQKGVETQEELRLYSNYQGLCYFSYQDTWTIADKTEMAVDTNDLVSEHGPIRRSLSVCERTPSKEDLIVFKAWNCS